MKFGGEINDQMANLLVAQLLFLASEDPEKEIGLYINSPGGSATAALSIYDAMIVAAALDAGCDRLWSEDMQNGMVIERSLCIVDPFMGTR